MGVSFVVPITIAIAITILYYTNIYYTILYYTILYYTILYYTMLYYTILYYNIIATAWGKAVRSNCRPAGGKGQ